MFLCFFVYITLYIVKILNNSLIRPNSCFFITKGLALKSNPHNNAILICGIFAADASFFHFQEEFLFTNISSFPELNKN